MAFKIWLTWQVESHGYEYECEVDEVDMLIKFDVLGMVDMIALVSMVFLEVQFSTHQPNAASYDSMNKTTTSHVHTWGAIYFLFFSSHHDIMRNSDEADDSVLKATPPPLFPVSFAQQGSCVPGTCSSQTFRGVNDGVETSASVFQIDVERQKDGPAELSAPCLFFFCDLFLKGTFFVKATMLRFRGKAREISF